MVKWIVVMKIEPSICLDNWGKSRKTPVKIGRHWNFNPEPPEYKSSVLSLRHLSRYLFVVSWLNISLEIHIDPRPLLG